LPPHVTRDSEKKGVFLEMVSENLRLYEEMLASGMPKKSARYILPFCMAVGIYHFTINLRSLLNMFGLRLCVRASPEFRCLASQLYFKLLDEIPLLRGLVGCRGFMRGACPESDVTGVSVGKQHPSYPPCPFKNRDSNIYIPTFRELRRGFTSESSIWRGQLRFRRESSRVGFKGRILDSPSFPICRSQVDIEVEGDWRELLKEMRGFHWMIAYGDYLREIGYALSKIGIKWKVI